MRGDQADEPVLVLVCHPSPSPPSSTPPCCQPQSVKAADTHGRVKFVWGDRVTGFESGVEIAGTKRLGCHAMRWCVLSPSIWIACPRTHAPPSPTRRQPDGCEGADWERNRD